MTASRRAAVFDCDGLLVDSSAVWARGFDAAARFFGHELDATTHRRLVGSSVGSGARALSRLIGAPEEALRRIIMERLEAGVRLASPPALPGVRSFLEAVHGRLPLAVASNGPVAVVELMLERAGLRALFDAVCTAGEVRAAKPAPAVYLAACERLGADPAASVGFEDSAVGAQAVVAAGMSLVYVVDPLTVLPDGTALAATSFEDPRIADFVLGPPSEPGPQAARRDSAPRRRAEIRKKTPPRTA